MKRGSFNVSSLEFIFLESPNAETALLVISKSSGNRPKGAA